MKVFRLTCGALLALALGGCITVGGGDSILRGGTSITAPITTPVGKKELAVVYNTYLIAGKAYVRYRNLGICRASTIETLANPCARRSVLLALQASDRKAYAAIKTAGTFIRNNPTISALSVVNAARAAVDDFQAALAQIGA